MSNQPGAVQAEVISIGDEITNGRILDTNSQWLSQRLSGELGVRVLYHTAVGDQLQAMIAVFRQAIERSDIVISTGGLGPTADDLTRVALANATGRPLHENPQALDHVREIFRRRNRSMPKQNESQAIFPFGSEMIANPNGTAPGVALVLERSGREPCRLFCLPGVPAEMYDMWPQVREALRAAGIGARAIVHRDIKCFGAGESTIESMLPDLIRRGRHPTVGINASKNTIILRITAEGESRAECEAAIEPVAALIYERLGELVFGENDDELQNVVLRQLKSRGQTLGCVEWNTHGLLAEWLAQADAQSRVFAGGLVLSRENELEHVLDLRSTERQPLAAISAETTQLAARRVRELFAVDCALAVSPFATELGNDRPRPLYVAIATNDELIVREYALSGHPAFLAVLAAKHALNTLRLHMR